MCVLCVCYGWHEWHGCYEGAPRRRLYQEEGVMDKCYVCVVGGMSGMGVMKGAPRRRLYQEEGVMGKCYVCVVGVLWVA